MSDVELAGLDGANPLAFFAALGLLAVGERMGVPVRLRWTDTAIAHPVVSGGGDVHELAAMVDDDRRAWAGAVALTFPVNGAPADDVKFSAADLRRYVRACDAADDGGRSRSLSSVLVAEGVMDGKGDKGKPTDLHFTAGKQLFLEMTRVLAEQTTVADVEEALVGWRYERELPSLRWDVSDDRAFALSAVNPAIEKKRTVPGAEWLALMGITLMPSVQDGDRVVGPGLAGKWKSGRFVWPLWSRPVGFDAARTVILDFGRHPLPTWMEGTRTATSVFRVFEAAIRRSDQGGYGSFGPPKVVWEAM